MKGCNIYEVILMGYKIDGYGPDGVLVDKTNEISEIIEQVHGSALECV